jgi:hypothetical protein
MPDRGCRPRDAARQIDPPPETHNQFAMSDRAASRSGACAPTCRRGLELDHPFRDRPPMPAKGAIFLIRRPSDHDFYAPRKPGQKIQTSETLLRDT